MSKSERTTIADDLLLQNAEALAWDESYVPVTCVEYGCVDCPINGEKVKYVMIGYSLLPDD